MSYIVTNSDRMAMIKLLNHAWNAQFRASRDRAIRGNTPYTRWDVQAVNPVDNTYFTTDGSSLKEAVDKWFAKTASGKEEALNINSLYEAKLDFISTEWDKS